MPSQSDIAQQMRDTLALTEPELDTSTGSVARKMIDAVAEVVAESYIDQQMLGYTYDIDAKMEGDLDTFCELFGISRLSGKRASGVVVFARQDSSSEQFVVIPMGTQIVAREEPDAPPVIFQTLSTGFLAVGDTSVNIPVQCVMAGPEGNFPAGALNTLVSPLAGVSTISNPEPITGGTNVESDRELRERWKTTVFRNMAGTGQMYRGIALNNEYCTSVNVVGATKRRRDVLQIQGGTATSPISDAKFVYSGNVLVGPNIDNGDIFVEDLDFTFNSSVPPTITILNETEIPDETIVEMDFEYVPKMSRNDPANHITNRIDLWCVGTQSMPASQVVVFRSSPIFSNDVGSTYYSGSFVRSDGTPPEAGHTFTPLAFGPLVTVPNTITVGGTTYGLVTPDHPMDSEADGILYAYRMVHNNTAFGWAPNSLFGLEWSDINQPNGGETFEIEYFYNNVPRQIQNTSDQWRLVGTDALVHQAIMHNIRVNVVIQYSNHLQADEVDENINAQLSSFFQDIPIAGVIQPSDVLTAIANVSGVDAVRWQHGSDHDGYDPMDPNSFDVGMQRIVENQVVESYVDETGRPYDIHLGDSDAAALGNVRIDVRASNNFGAS